MGTATHNSCRDVVRSVMAYTVVLIVFVLSMATAAHAQDASSAVGSSIDLVPQYPQENEVVRATLNTYYIDLKTALVTWRVDGEVVLQGYGARTYSFTTGAVGSINAVEVTATAPDGRTVSARVSVAPSDVAVVWEGDTYVPPLYQGRAFFTPGSSVRLYAVPSVPRTATALYDPSELFYEWSIGRTPIDGGRGKQSITISDLREFNNLSVVLMIKDPGGNVRLVRVIEVPTQYPKLYYYIDNRLYGLLREQALKNTYTMSTNDELLVAEPYFIAAKGRADEHLGYEWKVGAQTLELKGTIVLSPDGIAESTTRVSTSIRNNNIPYQNVQQQVTVRYNVDNLTTNATTPL